MEQLRLDDTLLDDEGEPLHYLCVGEFIRHLVLLRVSAETDEFPAVFDVVERLVTDGDDYVRNLGVIGFLEGLQMRTVTGAGLDPEEFRQWFGPISDRWWERINQFWAGDVTALRTDDP